MADIELAAPAPTSAFVIVTILVAITAAVRGVWSPCGLSMISAINPFTEQSRGNRYWLTAVWFVVGSVIGGAVFGAIGVLGAWLLRPLTGDVMVTAAMAGACCLLAAASDTSAFGFRLPRHPRQVDELWLGRYRRWVYASGFGAQIGCGFATYIMTAAVYLTPVLAALSGSPELALLVGVVFGLVRGLAVLVSCRATDPAGLRRLHRGLDRLEPWSLRVAITAQAVAATIFGYAAAGLPGMIGVGLLLSGAAFQLRRQSVKRGVSQCSAVSTRTSSSADGGAGCTASRTP